MLRVAGFGGVGVCIQTVFFEIVGIWLKLLPASTASLIGAEVGIVAAFVLNNRFSFAGAAHAPLWKRFALFHVVVSSSLLIQWICLFSTEQFTDAWLPIHAAYAAGILLGFVSNYTGYRLWVWRRIEPTSGTPPQKSL